VATTPIGATTIVEYLRSGVRKETQVTMMAAPETVERDDKTIEGRNPLAGLVVANLSPAVSDELGLAADSTGVAALRVERGPAKRFFRPGDIILEINGNAIDSVGTLLDVIAVDEGFWRIAINRGGRILTLSISG
jgi:S1-C subfamily serine protease